MQREQQQICGIQAGLNIACLQEMQKLVKISNKDVNIPFGTRHKLAIQLVCAGDLYFQLSDRGPTNQTLGTSLRDDFLNHLFTQLDFSFAMFYLIVNLIYIKIKIFDTWIIIGQNLWLKKQITNSLSKNISYCFLMLRVSNCAQ